MLQHFSSMTIHPKGRNTRTKIWSKQARHKVLKLNLALLISSCLFSMQLLRAQTLDLAKPDIDLLNSLTQEEKDFLHTHPVVTIANQKAWPPIDFAEDSIPMGYGIEHIQLLAAKLGLQTVFVQDYRWINLFEQFKDGKIDVMPNLYKNAQREPYTLYTDAFLKSRLSLYSTEENKSLNQVEDLRDGLKVGIHQADASIPYLKKKFPEIELVEYSGSKDIIKALASREVDAVIENAYIFHYNVKQFQVYNLKLVDFIEPENTDLNPSLHIGVRKDLPLLHRMLQKAMLRVSEEEKYLLQEKWLGNITNIHKDIALSAEEKAYLLQKDTLKVCVDPNWMPFERIEKKGGYIGISADVVQLLSELITRPIVLIPTQTWVESVENLRAGRCDFIPMIAHSPERSEFMLFTPPYITETVVVATRQDEFFIQESSELKNKKIGVVEGYVYIDLLKAKHPDITIVPVKDTDDGLKRVQKGELFGFIDVLPSIAYAIQTNGMLDLKVAGRLEFNAAFSMATHHQDSLLNSILGKALRHIKEEQIRTISGKWVAIKVEQAFDYKKLMLISLFFVLILLVILFKNRSIRRMNKALERSYREKDKFFSIIAHDLKGPIGNIANILNTFDLDTLKGKLHFHLKASAQNTYELLIELLTWAQVQQKQLDITPCNFNLTQVLQKAVSSLQLSAEKKNVELLFDAETEAMYVYADKPTIHTVIRNLISNAIKFTPAGGSVKIAIERISNQVKVRVVDTGIGMSPKVVSKLFKLGEEISTPGTQGEKGTGLGLLLCKEFMELNKGQIGVESEADQGSSFWFTLAAGKEQDLTQLLPQLKAKQFEALIVEDNFLNLHSTMNELTKAGIRYEIAQDGLKGLEMGTSKAYDLILLDIDLPGVDGLEVNRNIRKKYPSATILALSSYSRTEILDRDQNILFDAYLKKPLKIDHLLNTLIRLELI